MAKLIVNEEKELDFTNYVNEKTQDFIGREWLFTLIKNWLADPNGARYFLLTGEPGSGKTAIAGELIKNAIKPKPDSQIPFLHTAHFCSASRLSWIVPTNFAESIALQLAQIEEYAKALLQIDTKQITINSNFTAGTVISSSVQGVVIHNLDLRGVISAQEAFNLLVIKPLQQIYRDSSFQQQITILVDSLDESLAFVGKPDIIDLLAAVEELPKQVRFLLTSRSKLEALESLRDRALEYSLSMGEGLQESRKDVNQYILNSLDQQLDLIAQFAEGLSKDDFVSAVRDKSDGNFLYITYLLKMLAHEQLEISKAVLDKLPNGLDGIYREFLSRLVGKDRKIWRNQYAPVLGTLAVVQEALSKEQLAKFVDMKKTEVQGVLEDLHQFLDVDETLPQSQHTYIIYHRSLADFLIIEDCAETYFCDEQEQHNRIIDYYLDGKQSWDEVLLKKIDLYGRRHLAQHLVKGDRVEELHALLSRDDIENQNAWFSIKEMYGETASYIEDIKLAWQQARHAFKENPAKAIGLMCRYALINTSIRSLANVPPELIVALVEYSDWTLEQGFAYACQMPNLSKKLIALEGLLDLPNLEQNAPETFTKIQDELHRLRPLVNNNLDENLNNISANILHSSESTDYQLILHEILEIPDQRQQMESLNELLQRILDSQSSLEFSSEVLNTILDIVINSKIERYQAQILIKLAPYLNHDLLQEKALKVARSVSEKNRKVRLFAALVKKLPSVSKSHQSLKCELLKEARESAESIKYDELNLIKLRIKLVSQLYNTKEEKLQEIAYSEIRNILKKSKWAFQEHQAKALIKLAPYTLHSLQLQEEIYNTSLAIASNLEGVLISLVPHLTGSLKEKACTQILAIQELLDEHKKELLIESLTKLLPHVPEQLEKFIECILKLISRANHNAWINKDWHQIKEEIRGLIPYLRDDSYRLHRLQALQIVLRMQSSGEKIEALAELSSTFSNPVQKEKILRKALETYKLFIQAVQNSNEVPSLKVGPQKNALIPSQENIFPEPSPVAKLSGSQQPQLDPEDKVQILAKIAKYCSNPLRHQVLGVILKIVAEIPEETIQVKILTKLVAHKQDFPDFQTNKILKEKVLKIALETKFKIQDKKSHIKELTKLVTHFPEFQTPEMLESILQSVSEFDDDLETQFDVLTQVALSSVTLVRKKAWQQIQKNFANFQHQEVREKLRVNQLLELLSNIKDEFKQEVLEQTQEITSYLQDVKLKVDLFKGLIPHLPNEDQIQRWYEACKSALTISDDLHRKKILSELAELLTKLLEFLDEGILKPLLKSLWHETFDINDHYSTEGRLKNRQNLLMNIHALSPTLCFLGETNPIPEVLNEIQNVQRWWP